MPRRAVAALTLGCVLALPAADWASQAAKDIAAVQARRNYWAFQPPVRQDPPVIRDAWVRSPIDSFILDALRAKKLTPSRELDRAGLIRRVTYDLTGLPPAPGEVDLFVHDKRADAYERLVDRLMASPQYGERWGQRWLDVVRYADTNGYELDGDRPHAWRYRDYVVAAFNKDKPYDRFVREQLAGDVLFPGDREALIATGFNRAGPIHIVGGNKDEEADRQEVLVEMTSAIGAVYLGLTVGCARCHNHKFDPILQADYYRLQAFYAATDLKDIELASPTEKAAYEAAKKVHEERLAPIKKELDAMEKPFRDALTEKRRARLEPQFRAALEIPEKDRTPEQKRLASEAKAQVKIMWDELVDALPPEIATKRAKLRERMHAIAFEEPDPPTAAYAVSDMEKAPPTHILKVGDVKYKLDQVEPGFLSVLDGGATAAKDAKGRRAVLANWIASSGNPLAARVMVNRIWQFRMGTGLVATPNDFGALGSRPSNPKLLDWLATEFVARGWSVKAIDRMIVLSSVYRQASAPDAAKAKIDAENQLHWRMNRKRMEGEAIRDAILQVAGTLNPRMGGKPVRIPIEQEVYDLLFTEGERDGLWAVTADAREHNRRSLYLLNKRSVRLPMLAAFDQPDSLTSCPIRPVSTHALQALNLMNSDFMREQSAALAARLERECGQDRAFQVRRAYKLALARAPRPEEAKMAADFLAGGAPLSDFCLALLNRNEFVYVP